jgi:hypothetical protein
MSAMGLPPTRHLVAWWTSCEYSADRRSWERLRTLSAFGKTHSLAVGVR